MAEIGIILLLFEVALETDLKRLTRTGAKSVFVSLVGFILPLLFGFLLSYWLFELSLLVSLFAGGTLTGTSIGITVRVLADLKRQQSREGQIALGAAGQALSRRFFLPFGIALHADPSFAERIEKQMRPIIQLFTPIFFVYVGLSLNLWEIDWSSPFIRPFSLLVLALTGKLLVTLFIRET